MKQFDFYHTKCTITGSLARDVSRHLDARTAPDVAELTVSKSSRGCSITGYADDLVKTMLRFGVALDLALSAIFRSRPRNEVALFERLPFKVWGMEAVTDNLVYVGHNDVLYYAYRSGCADLNPLEWRTMRVTDVAVVLNSVDRSTVWLQFEDLVALSGHATIKLKELRLSQ